MTDSMPDNQPVPRVDARTCAELGRVVEAARVQRGLSPDDVAARLLLWPEQVHALEHGDAGAFETPVAFAYALRKYAAFLGITSGLLADILTMAPPGSPEPASPPPREPQGPRAPRVPREGPTWMRGLCLLLTAAAVVLAAGMAVAWYLGRPRPIDSGDPVPAAAQSPTVLTEAAPVSVPVEPEVEPEVEPPPAPVRPAPAPPRPTPVAAPPVAAPPVAAPPVAAPPVAAPPVAAAAPEPAEEAGRVVVPRTAWVFVRYGDNRTVERTFQGGGELALRAIPIYLAVGYVGPGSGEVDLTLAGRPVDIAPFTQGNEIRIDRADLARLAAR